MKSSKWIPGAIGAAGLAIAAILMFRPVTVTGPFEGGSTLTIGPDGRTAPPMSSAAAMVPQRCDSHAIARDYSTYLPYWRECRDAATTRQILAGSTFGASVLAGFAVRKTQRRNRRPRAKVLMSEPLN